MMVRRVLKIVTISLAVTVFSSNAYMSSRHGRRTGSSTLQLQSRHNSDEGPSIQFEVVGGSGRIGSLFLRQQGSIAVARGIAPGCQSVAGCPIVVATPSIAWSQIRNNADKRLNDIVWIGLLENCMQNETVIIPHFGVLTVGDEPVTDVKSPATYCYGRHAEWVANILEKKGIKTQIVSDWQSIKYYAAQKLLWASVMWLLCHSQEGEPLTVVQVHEQRQDELTKLVQELLPAFEKIIDTTERVNVDSMMQYMYDYSHSMPAAVPSKELALDEMNERNGVLLAHESDEYPQPLHKALLQQVAGMDGLSRTSQPTKAAQDDSSREKYLADSLGVTLLGEKSTVQQEPVKSVVVIGGGIIGSSIALQLARKSINVTVIDKLPKANCGATTAASWAWINANQKKPLQYQCLNQLGMLGWKKDSIYAQHADWCGSLVQFTDEQIFLGAYPCTGPLTSKQVHDIEPNADFESDKGDIYHFPDEACVDPAVAISCIQDECRKLGVTFLHEHRIESILRNSIGDAIGVKAVSTSSSTVPPIVIKSDKVIVAAGVGASAVELGALPLKHSPGMTAYASFDHDQTEKCLSTILVDTHRQSHVLQRRDGSIVAGGGFLEVGGLPVSTLSELTGDATTDSQHEAKGRLILETSKQLAPKVLHDVKYTHAAQALRPIPMDGFPAIGYVKDDNVYYAVTHSGMTMAPVIGAAVAIEIAHNTKLELLRTYRPSRLYKPVEQKKDNAQKQQQ